MPVSRRPEAAERELANLTPAPPAPEGNTRNLRHGARARSDRHVAARAAELVAQVVDAHPHLESVRDRASVLRYCTILARIEQVYTWLDEQPHAVFEDARRGKTHPVYERLEKWEAAADRAEARLGISPRARFELFAELPGSGPPPVDRTVVTDPAVRAAARQLVDAAARARAASDAPAGRQHLNQPDRGGQHE
jgi:hypothetical protein